MDYRKFWACRRVQKVGPFATRQEAIDAFRFEFPHKGPPYSRSSSKNMFHTGYGETGPNFSLLWHDA